jgi:hypothetical protein
MDLKTSWPKLVFAGVVAVVPAVLSYCKSSQEADHARVEADAGYKALVQSVRNLEMMVSAQNNAIDLLTHARLSAGAGAGSADPAAGSAASGSGAEPLPAPNFPELPDSTAAALRMQSKE